MEEQESSRPDPPERDREEASGDTPSPAPIDDLKAPQRALEALRAQQRAVDNLKAPQRALEALRAQQRAMKGFNAPERLLETLLANRVALDRARAALGSLTVTAEAFTAALQDPRVARAVVAAVPVDVVHSGQAFDIVQVHDAATAEVDADADAQMARKVIGIFASVCWSGILYTYLNAGDFADVSAGVWFLAVFLLLCGIWVYRDELLPPDD